MGYDVSRDRGKIGAEPPFGLEARAKTAFGKTSTESRHDAAGDVDAALCAERQRQIPGYRAEHRAKDRGRFLAQAILIRDCLVGDLSRRIGFDGNPVERRKGRVEIDEAWARKTALGRDLADTASH